MILFANDPPGASGPLLHALRADGLEVTSVALPEADPEAQVAILVAAIQKAGKAAIANRDPDPEVLGGFDPVVVMGYSTGAVAAARAVERLRGEYTHALLLLSPAWTILDEVKWPRASAPTCVLHGVRDAATPLALSRRWGARNPKAATLHEVDDDQRLLGSFATICEAAWTASL